MPLLGLLASSDGSVVGDDIEAGSCARHTIHAGDLRRVPTTAALIDVGSVIEHPAHVADPWCALITNGLGAPGSLTEEPTHVADVRRVPTADVL